MAAKSPVVITSSSPPPFRLPSETPPRASAAEPSSSPGLPSPSTFFKRPAAGLQAQTAPKIGFHSASSLLKSNYFCDEQAQESNNDHVSSRRNESKRPAAAADGVSKTKKKAYSKPATGATTAKERSDGTAKSTLHSVAYPDRSTERSGGRSHVPPGLLVPGDVEERPESKSRTPSISLSVYSFDAGLEPDARPPPVPNRATVRLREPLDGADDPARDIAMSGHDFRPGQQSATVKTTMLAKPVKKPRRRVAKTSADHGDEAPKQIKRRAPKSKAGDDPKEKPARKPIAKSASFVLNSDDLASTQFAGMDAAQVQGSRPPDLDAFRHDSAPVEKPKRAPRKTKKAEGGPPVQDAQDAAVQSNADKASAYFNQPTVPGDDSAIDLSMAMDVQAGTEPATATPVHAHQRRRSWTPVRDTMLPVDTHLDNSAALSEDDDPSALSLAAVVGNLAYNQQGIAVSHRAASGEGPLKRRRIELADEATAAPNAKKKPEAEQIVASEKVKKPKAVKKKPQTITELATKAYRPEEVAQAAQATVSSFFAAQSTITDGAPLLMPADDASSKPVKTRKPRQKKGSKDMNPDKPKKAAKAKSKPKARVNVDDLFGELYAPEQARLQEGRQDFLFGTSSQLGAEESPTFIRQMQLAVRESEVTSTARYSSTPIRKSCVAVPTAPHGTSLSCGQAARGLWCSAARDDRNDVLAVEHTPLSIDAISHPQPDVVPAKSPAPSDQVSVTASEQRGISVAPRPHSGVEPPSAPADNKLPSENVQDIVDLCYTSPVVQQRQDQGDVMTPLRDDPADQPSPPDIEDLPPTHVTQPQSVDPEPRSDDWAILEDSSPVVPLTIRRSPARAIKALPQLKRYATSPAPDRSALRALDANVSPHIRASPQNIFLAARHASSSAAQFRSKQRDHPASQASATPDKVAVSPKRPGRPPKHSRTSPSKLFTATQPVTSSDFVNIDEVSDDEPAIRPSPRRRRATSTPSPVRPLEFEIVASPAVKAKSKSKEVGPKDAVVPAAACSRLKPDDAAWISAIPTLFPQITATIKSTAPSTDLAKPTWYEKILLYDPIVLEDLTAWLNERGVRVQTRRLKPKPKVKVRRKKKDAQEQDTIEEVVIPDEYETLQEPLKPWMVQKWCEDKSVCCLWKEGLRGGVRTRY